MTPEVLVSARVRLLATLALAVVVAGAALLLAVLPSRDDVVRVLVLHSRTGPLADSEEPVLRATLAAIDDVNARGGLLGRRIKPTVVDGRSDPEVFAAEAERHLRGGEVAAIFGGWTSASRKAMIPSVERHDRLLFYPVQYEGLEQSPNVFYLGATANQQVLPGTGWAIRHLGPRLFLVGSDYVFPRTAHEVIREQARGLGAEIVGERYVPLRRSADLRPVVAAIARAKPDVVLNTINGAANRELFGQLRRAAGPVRDVPVVSFSVGETELAVLPPTARRFHYAVQPYFQSIPTRENRRFVATLQRRLGANHPVSDPMLAAWEGVQLWAQSVKRAESFETAVVREALKGATLSGPAGPVAVDASTQHLWLPSRVGRARPDGQFDVVFRSATSVRPRPFPRTRLRAEWHAFLRGLYDRWGGNWEAPS